jgi:adenylate kinase
LKLILLGPPGAGKGTIAAKISEKYGIPGISTGDLFRNAVKNSTPLGLKVKEIMGKGELVPDELTCDLVKERLGKDDVKNGYMLDGFPRTIPQAEALKDFAQIDKVINFICSNDVVISRLSGRRVCKDCGKIYHVTNMPPKTEGICDACGGELYTRDDDKIESIKNRLEVYKEQTEPLINFYKNLNILEDIDSSKTPKEAMEQIQSILG